MSTMQDVADRAGVSIASVSYVVNGTKPVAPATRARIEAAMAELNFQRNRAARALAIRRTQSLALVFPALDRRLGTTSIEFLTGAARTANECDYHLTLWPVSNDASELTDLVSVGVVDGVLLMEVLLDDPRVAALQKSKTPFVMIGRTAEPDGLPYVDIDFDATVAGALDHLESLGHRHIALVEESHANKDFLAYGPQVRTDAAFARLVEARGLSSVTVGCGQTAAAGAAVTRQLLADHPDITAVMVRNEQATLGVMLGVRQAGLRVPEDVSVLSLTTTTEISTMSEPALTIMRSPGDELGRLGVKMLVDHLDRGLDTPPQLIPCTLYRAGSTGEVR
ncbi:LacI family DNA-binding transcriptional regulator [Kribbella sp. CA-245084]|uniref:LacI family DNA-binding transcriptional regulator n=1 Tax=Kribbella sp. CA-245084 TaxID=3239940 RepID=UPI003D8F4ED8